MILKMSKNTNSNKSENLSHKGVKNMNNFNVQIKETYAYEVEVRADTKAEAIRKAKEIYDHVLDEGQNEYSFCADAYSHIKTTFTLE